MKQISLKINYLEFGFLYACIKKDAWDRMPRSLWLKLRIIGLEAYEKHESFNKESADTLKGWRKELQKLEGGQNV